MERETIKNERKKRGIQGREERLGTVGRAVGSGRRRREMKK